MAETGCDGACTEPLQEVAEIMAALITHTGATAVELSAEDLAKFTANHAVVLTRGEMDGSVRIEVRKVGEN